MRKLIEKQIIKLLSEKNEKAISLLYTHYADALYGVALKIMVDEKLAEDVLQESLVKVWKKGDRYDPSKSNLFTWLFRIIRNTAIDKLRSTHNKIEREVHLDISNTYNIGIYSTKPEHLDVAFHINQLEKKYSVVLKALFFQGMTQEEASKELKIPLGTVKSRLKIGLRELKRVYKN